MEALSDLVIKKSYKILLISFIILIGAVTFVYLRFPKNAKDDSPHDISQFYVEPITPGFVADASGGSTKRAKMPSPSSFKFFDYTGENTNLTVKNYCTNEFMTILIYPAEEDYRYNPAASRFNRAYACTQKGNVTEVIDLKKLNLPSGKYYYFVADQGKTGAWFNPR